MVKRPFRAVSGAIHFMGNLYSVKSNQSAESANSIGAYMQVENIWHI